MIEIPYRPLSHQRSFHRHPAPYRLFRGGVGSGKTLCGAAESIRLAVENPECDGMIVAPTWGILHRTTLRAFRSLLPRQILRREVKSERYIELVNLARIYYGSADRPDTLEGANLAWAWGDEGRYWDRVAWEILLARVREPRAKRRSIVMTSTPSMGWLYDYWGRGMEGYAEVAAPTEENPYLPPEYIETLRRSYSQDLYRQYVGGEWVHLEGGVFPEFSASSHVQPDLHIPSHPVHIAFDPGVQRSATLFFQHHRFCPRHRTEHCIHVLDECMLNDMPTVWAEQRWRGKYYEHGWKMGKVYLDAAGDSRSTSTGLSDVAILESAGWECIWTTDPFKRAIVAGISAIRGKLKPFLGSPSLYFDPRLLLDTSQRGILRSIRESRYPDAKGSNRDDQPIKDGILDHVRDALRYAIVNLCPLPAVSFVQPAK